MKGRRWWAEADTTQVAATSSPALSDDLVSPALGGVLAQELRDVSG